MRAPCQTPRLQKLASTASDYHRLREQLRLTESELPVSRPAHEQFAFKAPAAFVDRINPGDADDPLLKQIWPAPAEEIDAQGFVTDPVGDSAAITAPGLLQKYPGRALLIATNACAIHCRYCFRRHFPYDDHLTLNEGWAPALQEIAEDTSLKEIILSGGDPLTLSARRLQQLLDQLAAIPHLERLRIHSRVPVVNPERITAGMEEVLAHHPQPTVLVIHANHPAELDDSVHDTLWRLRRRGMTLLNQAVLLKGVNDRVDTLRRLHERLFECGALPYYLHQLDPVAGAAHFAVEKARACALITALRAGLPGYLVPRLVQELPGALAKVPLTD